MNKKLYYHKTVGGAEYLFDNHIVAPDGTKEGVVQGSTIMVRLDGQPEISITEPEIIVAVIPVDQSDITLESTAQEILDDKYVSTYDLETFFKLFNLNHTQAVNSELDYAFLIDKTNMKVLNER